MILLKQNYFLCYYDFKLLALILLCSSSSLQGSVKRISVWLGLCCLRNWLRLWDARSVWLDVPFLIPLSPCQLFFLFLFLLLFSLFYLSFLLATDFNYCYRSSNPHRLLRTRKWKLIRFLEIALKWLC